MLETPSDRLRRTRRQCGYSTAAAFARVAGVSEVTYRAQERGKDDYGGRALSQEAAKQYAEILNVSWRWLLTGMGAPSANNDHLRIDPESSELQEDSPTPGNAARAGLLEVRDPIRDNLGVPVWAAEAAGKRACLRFTGDIAEYVPRPPGIRGARGVFAFFVLCDCMAPRFERGDLLCVHPNRPVIEGCDVLIELNAEDVDPGPCLIRRLVRSAPSRITVEQFNPHIKEAELALNGVRKIYRILKVRELVGA